MNEHPLPDAWWTRAACIGTDWSLWAPPSQHSLRVLAVDERRYAEAATYCAACPVVAECRADADLTDDPAFRAGFSAVDRHRQNTGRW